MNQPDISRQQLMDLLEKINEFLDMRIDVFAVGGTALTLLGLKDSTRDIDLNIDSNDGRKKIEELFNAMNFKKTSGIGWETDVGFRIDLFSNGYIFCTQLPGDYAKLSKEIRNLGRLRLFAISPCDIIITKLGRGDGRDFDDIETIFRKEKIDVKKLADRFIKTMGNSMAPNAKGNMLILLKEKMKEWGIKADANAVEKVEKWQT